MVTKKQITDLKKGDIVRAVAYDHYSSRTDQGDPMDEEVCKIEFIGELLEVTKIYIRLRSVLGIGEARDEPWREGIHSVLISALIEIHKYGSVSSSPLNTESKGENDGSK